MSRLNLDCILLIIFGTYIFLFYKNWANLLIADNYFVLIAYKTTHFGCYFIYRWKTTVVSNFKRFSDNILSFSIFSSVSKFLLHFRLHSVLKFNYICTGLLVQQSVSHNINVHMIRRQDVHHHDSFTGDYNCIYHHCTAEEPVNILNAILLNSSYSHVFIYYFIRTCEAEKSRSNIGTYEEKPSKRNSDNNQK